MKIDLTSKQAEALKVLLLQDRTVDEFFGTDLFTTTQEMNDTFLDIYRKLEKKSR